MIFNPPTKAWFFLIYLLLACHCEEFAEVGRGEEGIYFLNVHYNSVIIIPKKAIKQV